MAFTFFFRDGQTLDLIVQHVVPDLCKNMYIRIWDAGCAMGPEPYSLAIILRENMGHFRFRNVKIHATDIDESDFGATIARGSYPETVLKRIPADLFEKYFAPDGTPGNYQICEDLRQAVHFEKHDLLSLEPVSNDFGMIMCKNVLLHFLPAERLQVIQMFHRALVDGGYFVTEQTQKLPVEMEHLFRPVTAAAQIWQKVV
jgi:chemotaxis protein methyltransferase CheR